MTTSSTVGTSVLDAAAWSALTGPHAGLALGDGPVRRYPSEVSPFVAFAPGSGGEVWAALAPLAGAKEILAFSGDGAQLKKLPAGWEVPLRGEGVQLVATDALATTADPEALVLGAADVPEMLELVRRTEPGPFLPRTVELGRYVGLRVDGTLVAMAGERLHPSGYTEISAVCTDAAFRGRGYAARLVLDVAHGIRGRGETPFLHAAATNTNAIRLYETLGFTLRRTVGFFGVRAP